MQQLLQDAAPRPPAEASRELCVAAAYPQHGCQSGHQQLAAQALQLIQAAA